MTGSSITPGQVRAAISLYDVVVETIPLERAGPAGSHSRGPCPFHRDPSRGLYVDASGALYRCFCCGRHGDVIRWTMDRDQVDEPEAVSRLARRAGLAG